MKKMKFLAVASLALLAVACSKDNGNYEYIVDKVDAVTISNRMRVNPQNLAGCAFTFKLGEDIVIDPIYDINDKSLSDSQLAFEWFYGGVVISTEKQFRLDPQPAAMYTGILQITDTRNGMKYAQEYNFEVQEKYTRGWALLTEEGSNSYLHFLTIDDETGEYMLEKDIYGNANGGAVLKSGVTMISQHSYATEPYSFSMCLCQPGPDGAIDFNIHNMSPLGIFNREFTGGGIGKDITKVAPMKDCTAATDADGALYIRQEAKQVYTMIPHAALFPAYPIVLEDGPVKVDHWVSTTAVANDMASLDDLIAFDSNKSRCLVISSGKVYPFDESIFSNSYEPHRGGPGYDGTNTYDDITYPDPFDLSKYNIIKMCGGGWDTDLMAAMFGDSALSIVFILEDKVTLKKYFYTFRFFSAYGSWDVDLDLFFPIPDDIVIDPATIVTKNVIGGPNSIVYFTANGNKDLYYINAIYGTVNKVLSSESPITGFGHGQVQNVMALFGDPFTQYYEKMVVGTQDGAVKVYKMDDMALATGNPQLLQTIPSPGGVLKLVEFMPDDVATY